MNVHICALLYETKSGDDWKPQKERKEFKVSVRNLTGWVSLPTLPQYHYTIYHITWGQSNSNPIWECKPTD